MSSKIRSWCKIKTVITKGQKKKDNICQAFLKGEKAWRVKKGEKQGTNDLEIEIEIIEIDIKTNSIVNNFINIAEASKISGIPDSTISRDCNKTRITKAFSRPTLFQKAKDIKYLNYLNKGGV